jgi:hypothetical protein
MKITEQISKITAITIEDKNLFSNLRCIKIRNTNDDLTAAISRAIATVRAPRYIWVINTEISVNVINPDRTIRNVR